MKDYYFPFDKNYITKEAQYSMREKLLVEMVSIVRKSYFNQYNPLGIEDEVIKVLKHQKTFHTQAFFTFYDNLAAIYRYRFGSNQLSIDFSGRSQHEKAAAEWEVFFKECIQKFAMHYPFLKVVLETSILYPYYFNYAGSATASNHKRIVYRMNGFLYQFFGIKLDRRRKYPILQQA